MNWTNFFSFLNEPLAEKKSILVKSKPNLKPTGTFLPLKVHCEGPETKITEISVKTPVSILVKLKDLETNSMQSMKKEGKSWVIFVQINSCLKDVF